MARRLQALRAAATSVRRPHPVQERHLAQRSEADHYAAAVAASYPRPRVAAQSGSAERPPAGRPRQAAALRPRAAAQSGSAGRPPAGRPRQAAVLRRRAVAVPVPVHFFAEAVPAHFFAEAAAQAQRSVELAVQHLAEPEVLAGQVVAPLPEESAARDVAAELPRVAGHAEAAEEPRPEAAAWVAAAVPRLEAAAARVAAGVLQPGAAARAGVAEVVRQPAARRDAAEAPRPAVPGVRVPARARPSAGLSVFRRDRLHRRPAPSPSARFARAMARL